MNISILKTAAAFGLGTGIFSLGCLVNSLPASALTFHFSGNFNFDEPSENTPFTGYISIEEETLRALLENSLVSYTPGQYAPELKYNDPVNIETEGVFSLNVNGTLFHSNTMTFMPLVMLNGPMALLGTGFGMVYENWRVSVGIECVYPERQCAGVLEDGSWIKGYDFPIHVTSNPDESEQSVPEPKTILGLIGLGAIALTKRHLFA